MINLGQSKKVFNPKIDIDSRFFNLGVFFLASTPFISCLFFLYPLFKGFSISKKNILKDRIYQILILISVVLILISLKSTFFISNNIDPWTSTLNWAGIVNFIPLFICFIGFDSYLNDEIKRHTVSKYFIAGTIPVLISCIGQFWFKWYGPFEIFNGLIIWFQRPLTLNNQNVTGLFSNPNYAGAWLTMMWPFSIALLREKLRSKEYLKSNIMFLIIIFLTASSLLTNSRIPWVGFGIIVPFLFGKKSLKWFIPSLIFLIFFLVSTNLTFIPAEIRDFSQDLIPSHIQFKIREITVDLDKFPRLEIWRNAIDFILQKPLFGWGANSFPYLYKLKTGFWNDHSHNLFLELSVSYGLLVSISLFTIISNILIKSFKSIFIIQNKSSFIDKGWWAAGFVFFITHLFDMLIFDIRINLAIWIILVALKNTYNNNSKIFLHQ